MVIHMKALKPVGKLGFAADELPYATSRSSLFEPTGDVDGLRLNGVEIHSGDIVDGMTFHYTRPNEEEIRYEGPYVGVYDHLVEGEEMEKLHFDGKHATISSNPVNMLEVTWNESTIATLFSETKDSYQAWEGEVRFHRNEKNGVVAYSGYWMSKGKRLKCHGVLSGVLPNEGTYIMSGKRGRQGGSPSAFYLPRNEYIVEVSGQQNKNWYGHAVISCVEFVTNRGTKYGPFGKKQAGKEVIRIDAGGSPLEYFEGVTNTYLQQLVVHSALGWSIRGWIILLSSLYLSQRATPKDLTVQIKRRIEPFTKENGEICFPGYASFLNIVQACVLHDLSEARIQETVILWMKLPEALFQNICMYL